MFVAQYYGKRDFRGVRTSAGLVLTYVLWVSMVFWGTTFFAPRILMGLFTNDTTLIYYGEKYLRMIGLSYVFSGALQVLQGVLKNCGYVGKCTIVSVVVVCLNIGLNENCRCGAGYCPCKWNWAGYYGMYASQKKEALDLTGRYKM